MLTRLSQIGIKIEGTEGTEETLGAPEFSGNRKEHAHTSDITEYERGLTRATLTPKPNLKAQFTGGVSFIEELVGGAAATPPPWDATLRGMGFTRADLKYVEVGGPAMNTDQLRIGQTLGNNATQGSATATGIFVGYKTGSPDRVVYLPVTGAFTASDSVYNYTVTQFSAEVNSSPAAAGYAYTPLTETTSSAPPSVTVERRFNTERHTRIGARGKGELSLRMGEPALLRVEYMGAPVYDSANPGRPRVAAAQSGLTAYSTPPKVTRGIPLSLVDGATEYTPVLTELVLGIDNTLAPRPTITSAQLADSGYMATRISDRKLTVRIDPEHLLPTVSGAVDFYAMLNTLKVFEVRTSIGTLTDVNGMIAVWAPAAQRVGNLESGDRDGIVTIPGEHLLTGDDDNCLYIFAAYLT